MDHSMQARVFLITCAVGLLPVALGYGAAPSVTLEGVLGISVDTTNLTHMMRAVMGLYFGMAALWLAGALIPALASPALIACGVFMLGLAAGRLLSFAVDGLPHWLFIVFTVLEVVLGLIALMLYRMEHAD